jgi:hypothetical protein
MSTIKNKEKWLSLYETAQSYKELAPWKWMGDAQVFGVEHPTEKTLHFCVVFGRGGIVYGLNVYKGVAGLDSYLGILEASPFDNPLFSQRAIALAFEDRKNLTKEDYQHIKKLGLKFRGKNSWTQFLDYTPGYHPWVMAEEDIDTMKMAMEQTMEVAKMVKADPDLIEDDYLLLNHTNDILIRKQVDGEWINTFHDSEKLIADWESQEEKNVPELNPGVIEALQQFKEKYLIGRKTLINGYEYMSAPIQENKEQRPVYPIMTFWLDKDSGMIVNQAMDSENRTEKTLFESLLGFVQQDKKLPAQIEVSNYTAYQYLYYLQEHWGTAVAYEPDDNTAKLFMMELMEYLDGRM